MFSDAYSFVARNWLQEWSIVEHSDVWFTGLDGRVVTIGAAEGLPDWVHSLWSPYVIEQTMIFLPCDFYLLSFFFLLFFPRLISAAVDWMSTILPHMVWP